MGPYFSEPLVFLIRTLFGLYILAVMLRFLLALSRADFYNPISQALVKVTQPALRPLRRVIPGLAGIDLAAIVLMLLLQLIQSVLTGLLSGRMLPPGPMVVVSIAELLQLLLNVYLFTIIIRAVLSWVNPGYTPFTALIDSLTDPVLRPAQRIIPPLGGLDLSPIAVILAIQLAKMLLLPPIYGLARALY